MSIGSAEVQFPVPPRGFDPLNATASQLQEYGFQPRPQGGAALTAWDQLMAHYKSTPTPSIALGPRISTPAQPHQQPVSASVTSGNWAGWLADSSSQEFVASQMNYTQPTAESTTCSNSKQAVWTGLGGYNSTQLVQDGTALPGTLSSGYNAWYEYLNGTSNHGPTILSKMSVAAGDSMHLYVSYSTANGSIDFYVANNTNGTSQSVVVSNVGTSYYDGSSADYITERPACGSNCLYPLHKFTTFSSNTAEAETTGGQWIPISSSPYPYKLLMYAGSTKLAAPSGLNSSGDGFSTTWYNCN